MGISKENLNMVLGLKVGWLRQKRQLSLKELSEKCGLSISYLNEIEKGKKYPKADKIMALSAALEVGYDQLVSLQLDHQLAPLSELLSSSILQEIPFEIFGLSQSDLMDLMTSRPAHFAALIDTVAKLAKSNDITVDQLLTGALKSYIEMNGFHFPEIEKKAESFKKNKKWGIRRPDFLTLKRYLEYQYKYSIDTGYLSGRTLPVHLRSLYLPKKKPRFYLHPSLSDSEKVFETGRQIGYEVLDLHERISTTALNKQATFDQLINTLQVSVFSSALMIDRKSFTSDISSFFDLTKFENETLKGLIKKFDVTVEQFFYRLAQILTSEFGISQFYLLKFSLNSKTGKFSLDDELHFGRLHDSSGIRDTEHFCRRWISTDLLRQASERITGYENILTGAQKSKFLESGIEYLCISGAQASSVEANTYSCITLGFVQNDTFLKKVKFADDPQISEQTVNKTCERCSIEDCNVRASEPVIYQKEQRLEHLADKINKIYGETL